MAEQGHRLHHFLWHAVRQGWLRFDDETKQLLRDIDWEPPRPSLYQDESAFESNNSGEDFLVMHRQMITLVNEILLRVRDPQYPKVEGWKKIPMPGDSEYPVPTVWDNASENIKTAKTNSFFNDYMRVEEMTYTDSSNLEGLTLGQLGSRIEHGIHNAMHLRWASKPPEGRPNIDPFNPDTIDPKWNAPSYDYLADPYSSHVNPIFWKLHGWIDDRIEDWKQANDITGPIPWSVQWDKNMMPEHHLVQTADTAFMIRNTTITEDNSNKMSEAIKIIQKSGIFPSFEKIEGMS